MSNEIIKSEARDITTERLSQLAAEIQIYSSNMLISIIEIGRRFEEAKSLCPYGEFGKWCKECTSYEQSMVENYIKIYREYGGGQLNLGGDFANSQSIATLGVTKLLELTKIPAEDRENFVNENNITSDTTVKELREKIRELENENKTLVNHQKELEDLREEKIAELEAGALNTAEELNQKERLVNELKEKQKKSNDEIKKLKSDIEMSERRSKERADQLAQAKQEIIKLKKAAEASGDTSIAKIEVLFSSVQNDLFALASLIRETGKEELLPKIKAVFDNVLQ